MLYCKKDAPALQLLFDISGVKNIVGSFDGGDISTDGGLLLAKLADERLGLSRQIALALKDSRQEGKTKYSLVQMILQRLFMILTGNEDLNDADRLASDPMHKVCVGRNPESDRDLASDSTLGRFEHGRTKEELEKLQELLVHLFMQSLPRVPDRIRLDIDGFCDEVHGQQQLSFYNGYYKTTCYIPLFVFVGTFPLAAILRSGQAGPAEGTVQALERIVRILRKKYPKVKIDLCADAGFDEPDIYEYCEKNQITYYIGLPSNPRLKEKSEYVVRVAERQFQDLQPQTAEQEGKVKQAEEKATEPHAVRVIHDITYAAESWTRNRRVIVRCDHDGINTDIRYVLTNHKGGRAKWLYEEKYCKRARCENVIKELRSISCDRLSYQKFEDNQFRLLMYTFAYILMNEIRDATPPTMQRMTVTTLQMRLLKVAVQIKETARQVVLKWTSSYPWQQAFSYTAQRLQL